jgi:signal transduction histidine kinase
MPVTIWLSKHTGVSRFSVWGIMLADVLEDARDQVADELERLAVARESTELPVAGRRRRLNALLQEVIEALRLGGADHLMERLPPLPPIKELGLELRERELVQRHLIEQIEAQHLEASIRETAVVAEWPGRAERKRLCELNRRLRALLDGVHESAVLLAPDGRILYGNLRATKAIHEVVGVPRSEILGKTPAELGIPTELVVGHSIEELVALGRAHQSVEVNAWGRMKEGRFDAIYGPDGTVSAIAILMRDIHNRKLAQTRLNLLTKLSTLVGMSDYEDVAEALVQVPIPDFADWCAVNFVENGRITRTFLAQRNPAKTFVRDALLRSLPAWDRHPLWREMMTGGFQLLSEVSNDVLHKLAASEEQYEVLAQVGIRSVLVVPLVARGHITGIITCAYTTESGRRYGRHDPALAEELALHAAHSFENARLMKDLKSTEARFRIALAGARTAVYEQDTSLRYVWHYNPMTPFQNALGKTHEQWLPHDEAAFLTELKTRVLDEGETVNAEMDLTLGLDEVRHFRETIEPLRDHMGKIVGVIGAATDITEQQHTQQRLTEEIGFRERMMGIIGHDLRNPITVISVASDLLLRRTDLPSEGRDQVLRIRRATGRMKEMIDTLLDLTRVRFLGRVPVSPEPADLAEISHGAIDEMRLAWPDRVIELEVHGDPHGQWDPARMSQTISNLVGNAIDHGDRDCPVRVYVDGDGRDVELKVHNDGEPIPPALLPVLFEPFRRGELGDRSPGGLGLGLYIVEQIVRAHEGTIGVESTATKGTTFTVHLPRTQAPTPAAQHA